MKQNIHPKYDNIIAQCSCGNIIHTKSTLINKKKINLDVCNLCHPFYTGKQRIIDTKGRVERFKKRFKHSKILG
ncbi:50S ribosomal protein L31 [Enterobacteriaceae endosymbiont of Plateumaris pusilla]|uniref:50S ribosomal protein L31 n=1 Tax=Enterobacteriaceae endosymbiont of Plateumaris pusilla TaxID=2675795 RepID=UPI0014490C90|nr:50S ribosomal protein L31 [Enterobacteriaceae endosymbiont of Plateumaris pusilla]QJC29682.1 50S ribosomal protein L31 [Enterobacteriaceae endosymbiont of Plateumaris pusilla]